MIRLVLMIGIAGSGKSTIAKTLKETYDRVDGQQSVIVSSDAIRAEILGSENDQTANDKVFAEVRKRINNNLSKRTVIVDATNINIKSRRSILEVGKKFPNVKKIAMVMTTPLEQAKAQNHSRDRVVPDWVLEKQAKQFEVPFYEEGFDEINFVGWNYSTEDFKILPKEDWMTDKDVIFKLMKDFDQKTHHHKYTLDKHCRLCAEKVKELKPNDDVLYRAAIIHDIGKLFVGEPKDDGSGDYRYYGHHNYGAYCLLQNLDEIGFQNFDDMLKVLFYVNYHMLPFFIDTEKARKEWERIMGKDNLDALFLFNKCDKYATGRED